MGFEYGAAAMVKLLQKVASFGTSVDDLKEIYVLFARCILEHSPPVWNSSLSVENSQDL